jgi:hypothetical protein
MINGGMGTSLEMLFEYQFKTKLRSAECLLNENACDLVRRSLSVSLFDSLNKESLFLTILFINSGAHSDTNRVISGNLTNIKQHKQMT